MLLRRGRRRRGWSSCGSRLGGRPVESLARVNGRRRRRGREEEAGREKVSTSARCRGREWRQKGRMTGSSNTPWNQCCQSHPPRNRASPPTNSGHRPWRRARLGHRPRPKELQRQSSRRRIGLWGYRLGRGSRWSGAVRFPGFGDGEGQRNAELRRRKRERREPTFKLLNET